MPVQTATRVSEVVVTARSRATGTYSRDGHTVDYPPGLNRHEQREVDDGLSPSIPEDICNNLDYSTPEKAEESRRAVYVAKVALELMSLQNANHREYGCFIYKDGNGNFAHTPFAESSTNHAAVDTSGLTPGDWARGVALLHSHPLQNMDPATGADMPYPYPGPNEDRLLRPSNDFEYPAPYGDWRVLDAYSNSVNYWAGQLNDHSQPGDQLTQYILGQSAGGNHFSLHSYTKTDRNTTTPSNFIDIAAASCN